MATEGPVAGAQAVPTEEHMAVDGSAATELPATAEAEPTPSDQPPTASEPPTAADGAAVEGPSCQGEPTPMEQPPAASEPPAAAEGAEAEGPLRAEGAITQQPKKPAGGAFGRFLAANRTQFAEECKGKPVTAVSKLASERYKALGEAEKAEWQRKFEEAKEQYAKDMEAFLAAGGETRQAAKKKGNIDGKTKSKIGGKPPRRKMDVDPNAPKKPVGGAFGCFLAKHRAEFQQQCQGQPVSMVTKMASSKWKAMADEEKKPYTEEFEKAMASYKEALKSYTPPVKPTEETQQRGKKSRASKLMTTKGKRIAKAGKRRAGKGKKDAQAPKKPVGGSYGRFLAKHRAEFQKECQGKPGSAVAQLASSKWSSMSEEDKRPYQAEYEKALTEYRETMKSFSPKVATDATSPKTPVKKARTTVAGAGSSKKMARKAGAVGKGTPPPLSAADLDPDVAGEAGKAGLTDALLKLAAREDVATSGKSQAAMLKALQESGGLLHPAKRALLSE